MRSSCLALIVLLTAAGCARTVVPYKPFRGNVGYDEAQLRPGEFTVFYTGPEGMGVGLATELAKVRAAELALARGSATFVITDAEAGMGEEVEYRPGYTRSGVGLGLGTGLGYRRGGFGGVGLGFGYSPGYVDIDRYPRVRLSVALRDGPDALDAEAVLAEARASNPFYPPPAPN